jgi:hypothetical protein
VICANRYLKLDQELAEEVEPNLAIKESHYPAVLQSRAEVKDFLGAAGGKVVIPKQQVLCANDELETVNVSHFESLASFYVVLEKNVDIYFRYSLKFLN